MPGYDTPSDRSEEEGETPWWGMSAADRDGDAYDEQTPRSDSDLLARAGMTAPDDRVPPDERNPPVRFPYEEYMQAARQLGEPAEPDEVSARRCGNCGRLVAPVRDTQDRSTLTCPSCGANWQAE